MGTKYPIYIPSKGRPETQITAKRLEDEGLSFWICVEPAEFAAYRAVWGDRVLDIGVDNSPISISYVRNWMLEHAKAAGHRRLWQLDDDMQKCILFNGPSDRKYCSFERCMTELEAWADRWQNMAMVGLANSVYGWQATQPIELNAQICGWFLTDTSIKARWRLRIAEDTDISLQILNSGLCTAMCYRFQFVTPGHAARAGGHTGDYTSGGKNRAARMMQRYWPGLVMERAKEHRMPAVFKRDGKVEVPTPYKIKKVWRQFQQKPIPIEPSE